jgi:hypothetical protein
VMTKYIIFVVLNLCDLLSTMFTTPELERNPLASFLWSRFGFGSVVALKVISVLWILACGQFAHKYLRRGEVLYTISIWFSNIVYLLILINNVSALLYNYHALPRSLR